MKIFAIQDGDNNNRSVGYLFYYEKAKEFYIELLDGLSEWDIPLLLSSLYRKGVRTVSSYWSKTWVQQRIVPSDRQNIGQILRENRLKSYDEFDLLVLADGRCIQDNFFVMKISERNLPEEIKGRFAYHLENIIPLKNNILWAFFRNGKVKKCDLNDFFRKEKGFHIIASYDCFQNAKMLVDGYGIFWDVNLLIDCKTLYEIGKEIVPTSDVFYRFAKENVYTGSEVMQELHCSRQ